MRKFLALGSAVVIALMIMSFGADEYNFGIKKFVGIWEFQAPNAPYGYQNGTINLTKEKKSLKGSVSIGSYTTDLHEISTQKDELNCYVLVEGEKVKLKLNFEKNSFDGLAMSSQGNIPMTGMRKSK